MARAKKVTLKTQYGDEIKVKPQTALNLLAPSFFTSNKYSIVNEEDYKFEVQNGEAVLISETGKKYKKIKPSGCC